MSTLHQPTVRDKIADRWKSADVVNFVEHGQSQNFADAGDSLQQKESHGIIDFGGSFEVQFQLAIFFIEVVEIGEIRRNTQLHTDVAEGLVDVDAFAGILQPLPPWMAFMN